MILKQTDCKNEDDGNPRRAFYRFVDGNHHVTVSVDFRKREAVVTIQHEPEFGGLRLIKAATFDMPRSLDEQAARGIAEGFYAEWVGRVAS